MPSGSELQVLLGNVVVAQLSGDLSQPVLNWTSEWRQGGFLLAPSLPWEVNGLPPSGAAVRNFFENMLPEGTAFDHLLEYAQISRSNSIGLALHLGNDLPGAIRLRTEIFFCRASVAAPERMYDDAACSCRRMADRQGRNEAGRCASSA